MKVLALIAASDVSGPCRGLFQLVEQTKDHGVGFILGMFLVKTVATSPAIEEARRRGFSVEVLSQGRRYDPGLLRQIRAIVHRHHIVILQSHSYKGAMLAWMVRRLSGLPWLAFAHGYTSENRRMTLYNRLDLWLLKRADRVVAVSGAMGRVLETAGVRADRITVIPNAIDPADYAVNPDGADWRRTTQISADAHLVGVIGRLSPEKGHAIFLDAFRRIARAVPNAMAVFVGEGPELHALRRSVTVLGLDRRVRFVGYQSDMAAIYAALDLVVIPSLSEGLPNVLLEAMLFGKAVVATAVGGIPEVLDGMDNPWVVPPGDADVLALAMTDALRDSDARRMVGVAGQVRVRARFSPAQRAQNMVALYHDLAAT